MLDIISLLASIIAVICVLCPHEFAHAFVAYKNGDPTAKMQGRLTLNPVKHFDIYGFITCALVGFGWAKPVPIDPYNFRNYRVGLFTTAIAGVSINYIIAFVAYPLYLLCGNILMPLVQSIPYFAYALDFLGYVFYLIYTYSLCIIVFNLLPFYPLDGFRVIESFTRPINPVHKFLKEYGQMFLIILVVESFACNILSNYVDWAQYFNILNYVMKFATYILGWPIWSLWELIIL
ncbi:MAG: site-2 protease family protein [Clostridiales bacterium]|nr:site-2 protease family protein [Clostridiales bacterium]